MLSPEHAVRDLNTCTVCVSSTNTSFESKRRAGGPVLLSYREYGSMDDDGAPDKDGELALVGTAQLAAPHPAEGVA